MNGYYSYCRGDITVLATVFQRSEEDGYFLDLKLWERCTESPNGVVGILNIHRTFNLSRYVEKSLTQTKTYGQLPTPHTVGTQQLTLHKVNTFDEWFPKLFEQWHKLQILA